MKRILLASVAVIGLVGPQPLARQQQGQYDIVVSAKDLMVPMRDGVKLATDVYRPVSGGRPVEAKLPMLLQRTPYDKKGRRLVEQARYFASHGYVVALQDERGAYKSEGVQTKYIGMGQDGYDTIEWLATLPYVNGDVGMWGTSYAAHAQASAAILNPPHLKTIVLNCGGLHNGWHHKIRNHGAFELAQQVGWAFTQVAAQTRDPVAREMLRRERAVDWVGALHAKRSLNPLSTAPSFEEYIFDMMTRADYDDYWKQPDVNWSLHFERTADIPMLHLSGWYDSYTAGAVLNYAGLAAVKRSPVRLLVGPWTHGGNTGSDAGEAEFGPDAAIRDFHDEFHLRWFDHFLKGRQNGVERDPAIKLFVMGGGDGHRDADGRMFHGGSWQTFAAWPIPGTRFTPYYFHGGGGLSAEAPAAHVAPTTYTYDPSHPVPTIGGSLSSQGGMVSAGAFDQREREFKGDAEKGFFGSRPPYLPLKARDDVLVFQTEALPEDVAVIGRIEVRLFAASSAVDTDFTAKLVDVYPPSRDYPSGFEMNITDGILRARYRNRPEKAELMTPGEVYEFIIEPFPTANVFKKGHRIRIDISSSNFPRFDVNPNTGEPLGMHRRTMRADNSVYHDASRPSRVILPIVASPIRPSEGPRAPKH